MYNFAQDVILSRCLKIEGRDEHKKFKGGVLHTLSSPINCIEIQKIGGRLALLRTRKKSYSWPKAVLVIRYACCLYGHSGRTGRVNLKISRNGVQTKVIIKWRKIAVIKADSR